MADSRSMVRRYISEGWSVIPIPKGEKGPRVPNWQNTTFGEEHFTEHDNIGVRLGDPSNGLTDVDLDCAEAITAARELLLVTQRIHGRPGKPSSHYWYYVPGAKTEQFKDTDGSVLVEIRSTGGQTVLPPSTHPSGESLAWEIDRDPGKLDKDALRDSVRLVATAALLARHWPKGSRHVVARDAAGFLASRDLAPPEIELVIRLAASIAGDDEVDDRARVARDTASTFAAGGKTTGLPSLEAALGADVTKRLRSWYGGANETFVDELNLKYFVVRVGSTEVIGREDGAEIVFQKERDVVLRFKNQLVAVGTKTTGRAPNQQTVPTYKTKYELWSMSPRRREYDRVVFCPPPRQCHEKTEYNLWRGFAVKPDVLPRPEERCSVFLDHARRVICNGVDSYYDYLIDLLALTVQEPGYPSEIAVVLRGHEGTGKGVFIRYFGDLFGSHYIQVDKPEHITGKFNQHLSGKVVVFADEAIWAGDKRDVGPLKRLITEDTLTIERKGIDATKEANCVHLFMATNEKWSTPAGFHSRRFFVLDVNNEHRQNAKYFAPLYAEQKAGGPAALLAFLLNHRVNRERLRNVPKTDALRVQQEYTMAPELKWWKACLFAGTVGDVEGWAGWISVDDLFYAYIGWCNTMRVNRRVTKHELAAVLRATLPAFASARKWCVARDEDGRRIPGDKVQRHAWQLPPLDVARRAFDQHAGIETPWESQDVTLDFELSDNESTM
jgi:hypothetical protein